MELGEQAGLSELITAKVSITTTSVASAGVNPAGKITSIVAGMAAGADCIDDLDVIRTGGMGRLFGGVYAPATIGQLLREPIVAQSDRRRRTQPLPHDVRRRPLRRSQL
jgi:hypothetical protein